jgi:hypothetical protein
MFTSLKMSCSMRMFSFADLHANSGAQLHAEILLLPPSLHNFHGHDAVDDHRAYGANHGSEFAGVQVEEISMQEWIKKKMLEKILQQTPQIWWPQIIIRQDLR